MFPLLSFQNYLISDPTGRNPENTVMTVVKQGFEPLPFTGQFPVWDYDLWNVRLSIGMDLFEIPSS